MSVEMTHYGLNPTEALCSVVNERHRQDAKWGEQNHPPEWWLAILMEEVGELATTALKLHFCGGEVSYNHRRTQDMRAEAVQVAAVAVALVECLDRHAENPHA